ncbi:MAG: hypothetical protein QW097_01795 [archaeon]
MPVVSQYPHFYEKDGKTKRNILQIEVEDPKMQGNFPKDGSITIRIQDEEAQKAFKMNVQEALQLGEELTQIAKEMLAMKRKLWKDKKS